MIQDENDPKMIVAHQELLRRLGIALGDGRQPLTKQFLGNLFEVIRNHRTQCRQNNIDFPVLVALVVPRLGIVEFVRADLDISSVKQKIINFVRDHSAATMQEVVAAFRGAYPDLRPDDVLSGHDSGVKANERQDERMQKIIKDIEPESDEEPL